MKKLILLLVIFYTNSIFAQTKEEQTFTICGESNPVAYEKFKKCAKITSADPNIKIVSFQLIFNSVEGVAIYDMKSDTFDETLLGLVEKGKPVKLHLNIKATLNGIAKNYNDVFIKLKYN